MQASNKPYEIFNFFSKKNRLRFRDAFLEHFEMSASAFYNKVRDNGFAGEEKIWIEKYGREHGWEPQEEKPMQKKRPRLKAKSNQTETRAA